MRESLLNRLLIFFGFKKAKNINFKDMFAELSSQKKQDEVRMIAYQAIQSGDDIKPDRNHTYEATLHTDSLMVDGACTKHHVNIIKGFFEDAQHLLVLIQSGLHSELNNTSPPEIEGKIKSAIAEHQAEANEIVERYKVAKKDLAIFKGANNIHAAAVYPDKSNAMWWLAFFGVIEALFNAFFLRQGINFIQSLFIAFGAAGINIIGNAFLGTNFRIKNHKDLKKARLGKIFFTLAFLLIFIINGGIAFYRLRYASMAEGLTDAFWLESAVLFIVGIGMGIAAFYKGYGMDDPYPQHGHYDREFKKRAKRLQAIQSAHALYCTSLKHEADSNLDHLGTKILTTFDVFGNYLPEMARCLKTWEGDRTQINFVYRQLQEIFKITISAHHPKGQNDYPQDIHDLPKNTQLESYKMQIDSFIKRERAIKEQVAKLRQSVIAQKEVLQKWWQDSGTVALLEYPKLGAENNKSHEKPDLLS